MEVHAARIAALAAPAERTGLDGDVLARMDACCADGAAPAQQAQSLVAGAPSRYVAAVCDALCELRRASGDGGGGADGEQDAGTDGDDAWGAAGVPLTFSRHMRIVCETLYVVALHRAVPAALQPSTEQLIGVRGAATAAAADDGDDGDRAALRAALRALDISLPIGAALRLRAAGELVHVALGGGVAAGAVVPALVPGLVVYLLHEGYAPASRAREAVELLVVLADRFPRVMTVDACVRVRAALARVDAADRTRFAWFARRATALLYALVAERGGVAALMSVLCDEASVDVAVGAAAGVRSGAGPDATTRAARDRETAAMVARVVVDAPSFVSRADYTPKVARQLVALLGTRVDGVTRECAAACVGALASTSADACGELCDDALQPLLLLTPLGADHVADARSRDAEQPHRQQTSVLLCSETQLASAIAFLSNVLESGHGLAVRAVQPYGVRLAAVLVYLFAVARDSGSGIAAELRQVLRQVLANAEAPLVLLLAVLHVLKLVPSAALAAARADASYVAVPAVLPLGAAGGDPSDVVAAVRGEQGGLALALVRVGAAQPPSGSTAASDGAMDGGVLVGDGAVDVSIASLRGVFVDVLADSSLREVARALCVALVRECQLAGVRRAALRDRERVATSDDDAFVVDGATASAGADAASDAGTAAHAGLLDFVLAFVEEFGESLLERREDMLRLASVLLTSDAEEVRATALNLVTSLCTSVAPREQHSASAAGAVPFSGEFVRELEAVDRVVRGTPSAGASAEFADLLAATRVAVTATLRTAASRPTTGGEAARGAASAAGHTLSDVLRLLREPWLPVRAGALIELRGMIEGGALSEEGASTELLYDLFSAELGSTDSYMYLTCIQGLEILGACRPVRTIQLLCEAVCAADRDQDVRVKAVESLVRVVKRRGPAVVKHARYLADVLLDQVRGGQAALRASAVSALGTLFCELDVSVHAFADELLGCFAQVLRRDHAAEVRRAAAHALAQAVARAGDKLDDVFGDAFTPVFDALHVAATADDDAAVRRHCHDAIGAVRAFTRRLTSDALDRVQYRVSIPTPHVWDARGSAGP